MFAFIALKTSHETGGGGGGGGGVLPEKLGGDVRPASQNP